MDRVPAKTKLSLRPHALFIRGAMANSRDTGPKFVIPRRRHRCKEDRRTDAVEAASSVAREASSMPSLPGADAVDDCLGNLSSTGGYAINDPGYNSAMTMWYLPQVVTTYGFETLALAPKTNRRESLFFRRTGERIRHTNSVRRLSSLVVQLPLDADDTASNGSPRGSSGSDGDSPDADILVPWCDWENEARGRMASWENAQKNRRKAFLLDTPINLLDVKRDEDPHECSPNEEDPPLNTQVARRRLSKLPVVGGTRKRRSRQESPGNRFAALQQLHVACARQLQRTDLGEIEMILRYDTRNDRLFVLLMRCENIGRGKGLSSEQVRSSVKLSIWPPMTKSQVQKTSTVTKTFDPCFDEEFAFENVSRGVMQNSWLLLRVCNKRKALHPAHIGEVWLSLSQLMQKGHMHIKEDLEPKQHFRFQAQRRLKLGLNYSAKEGSLAVVVNKLDNSRTHGCVKLAVKDYRVEVELTQVGHNKDSLDTDIRKTRARRSGDSAVLFFDESFTFHVNETRNIHDALMLVCRVVHRNPLQGKGTVIGQVRFGVGATQASANKQWSNLLNSPGPSRPTWHNLVNV